MTTPVPGWYPDPGGLPQLRWWDGGQWTHDTVAPVGPPAPVAPGVGPTTLPPPPVEPPSPGGPAAAAGPGPAGSGPAGSGPAGARPADRATWAADAPPGAVLFDEKISGVGVNGRQLRITPEQVVWGKSTCSLAAVRGVAYWVVHHYTNAVPSGVERTFVLSTDDDEIKIPLHSAKLNPTKRKNEGYFDRLVQISEQLIEPRLHDEAAAAIAEGGSVSFGRISYDRAGIHFAGKKGTDSYPWRSVDEVKLEKGSLVISIASGTDQSMLLKLPLSSTNAMVAARLVGTCAARYS